MAEAYFMTLVILCSPISASANIPVVNTDKNKAPFIAWEHYLQECGAELPHQCSGSKKALNQTCMFDTDCIAPAVCHKGKCDCCKGFVPYKERCLKAPTLDQQCLDGQCDSPLICTKRDTCDCPRTMDRTDVGCDARCPHEHIIVDGECLPVAKINGKCKANLQCTTAFAYCHAEKCQCVNGTKHQGDRCVAHPVCPDGSEPMKLRNNEYVKCHGQTCPTNQLPTMPTRLKLDSCPENHFCVFPSFQDADGFCCPEKPYCPMGDHLAGKNCVNPRNEIERCPTETHHCYAAARGAFCCPLPCPSLGLRTTIVVDQGHCYEKKNLNEKCNVTAQCPRPSECINGTCQCPEGFSYQYGPLGEKCQKQCPSGRVLVGVECLAFVLPAEKCTHSAQCTAGTKCIAHICGCPCGTISYNGNCVDIPECPNFGNGIYDPLKTKKGALLECSPDGFYKPNSPPPCPDKSFCHRALIYSGGICCPLPEPTCQNGRTPPRNRDNEPIICDFGGNSSSTTFCPRNLYCYDYTRVILPTLGSNAGRRGVCCALDSASGSGFYQQQKQLQWLQQSIYQQPQTTSIECPLGHRAKQYNGQVLRCPYYFYKGQCGTDGSCFLHPSPSARFQNAEGVCCTWR